jgi:hypothetical protein
MKNKLVSVMFLLLLMSSLALAQVDQATGTVTNFETQGMLRVNYCVVGGPNVDVLVNGEVPVIGGVLPTDHEFGLFTGYLYLTPGTYSVAVVPTGEGVEEALMEPVDVSVQAGHRYTVSVLGQADEPSYTPLVIDETATYQEIGAQPSENTQIIINNLKGVSGLDYSVGGEVQLENVPYGGYKAAVWPGGVVDQKITDSGTSEQLFPQETTYNIAATDILDCSGGTYPGTLGWDFGNHPSRPTSTLNTVELLQVQNEVAAQYGGRTFVFNTFLNAIETAGLTGLLTTGSPYMLFAPTDEAFEALPKEELDALMADPETLADLLRAHIVEGYYPPGSLGSGGIDRTVTNLLGSELVLTGGGELVANGVYMASGGDYTLLTNGSRVFLVTSLLPPEE